MLCILFFFSTRLFSTPVFRGLSGNRALPCKVKFVNPKNPFQYASFVISIFLHLKRISVYCFLSILYINAKNFRTRFLQQASFGTPILGNSQYRVLCKMQIRKSPCSTPVLFEKKCLKKVQKIEHGIFSRPVLVPPFWEILNTVYFAKCKSENPFAVCQFCLKNIFFFYKLKTGALQIPCSILPFSSF